jgi:hypothetical protein
MRVPLVTFETARLTGLARRDSRAASGPNVIKFLVRRYVTVVFPAKPVRLAQPDLGDKIALGFATLVLAAAVRAAG